MKYKNRLWYFAHPYSAKKDDGTEDTGKQEENFRKCNERAGILLKKGLKIYSPISMTHGIHLVSPMEHHEWMKLDYAYMERCDGLILPMEEWKSSKGCQAEYNYFYLREFPISEYNFEKDEWNWMYNNKVSIGYHQIPDFLR